MSASNIMRQSHSNPALSSSQSSDEPDLSETLVKRSVTLPDMNFETEEQPEEMPKKKAVPKRVRGRSGTRKSARKNVKTEIESSD